MLLGHGGPPLQNFFCEADATHSRPVKDNKVIYSMVRVRKYYDKKPVLKGISLSIFFGANIGVLSLNGAGKSYLHRILVGVGSEFNATSIHYILVFAVRNSSLQWDIISLMVCY